MSGMTPKKLREIVEITDLLPDPTKADTWFLARDDGTIHEDNSTLKDLMFKQHQAEVQLEAVKQKIRRLIEIA
jgi:hypothetical protein